MSANQKDHEPAFFEPGKNPMIESILDMAHLLCKIVGPETVVMYLIVAAVNLAAEFDVPNFKEDLRSVADDYDADVRAYKLANARAAGKE